VKKRINSNMDFIFMVSVLVFNVGIGENVLFSGDRSFLSDCEGSKKKVLNLGC